MRVWTSIAAVVLGTFLALSPVWRGVEELAAQDANPADNAKDIEILGHGPIHEAFAQPAAATLESSNLVQKKPRDPIEELPPDVKPEGDNVVWIPGYWAFDTERTDFIWVSGFWRNVPPDRVWVGGYWVAEGNNYRWVHGYWSAVEARQVYYPPPPEVLVEAQPPAPNDGSFYVAGTWVYRDTRYLWRPGYWTPYRAGWLWTQPRYSWTPGGYIFVDGYWDYDFNRRGVLFAPAYFGPQYFGGNRFYRPSFALSTNLLYASLFVRPNAGAYYFGDYYGPRYAGLGYSPWLDYRYRGQYADPAWSYYAWNNRGTPRWEEQMRTSYASRQRGDSPAPPRRIDAQASSQPQPGGNNNTQTVNLVVPLRQMQTGNDVKLRAVSKDESATIKKDVDTTRQLAKTRENVERKIDVKGSRDKAVQADLPLPKVAAGGGKREQPPPAPQVPQPDAKAPPAKAKDSSPDAKTPAPGVPAPPLPPAKGKDAPPNPKTTPAPVPPPDAKAPPVKTKDSPPDEKTPAPGTSAPPLPPAKGKDAPPNPKTTPAPTPVPPPVPAPKGNIPPAPSVKDVPKTNPLPKAAPPAAPVQPKVKDAPPPPVKVEPKPNPAPKALPPVQPAPPKAAPPPSPAPKAAPVTPPAAPPPAPRVEKTPPAPNPSPRPETPKGKGKDKD